MKRLMIVVALFSLVPTSPFLLAQSSNTARICVYGSDTKYANTLAGQVNYSPQARNQRDLVVKYLNSVKASANPRVQLEGVALTTQNRDEVLAEAVANGCLYLLSISLRVVGWPQSNASDETVYEKYGAGVDPPVADQNAPLTYVLMYHKSPHLWVSYPYGSYSQYKWFAKDVADVAYATILQNPTP
ncbi:MAG TPA: hypothetical protein VMT56_02355 [Candidatus Bathyarchaeia archaeon]|nr:hypothetical protein [Candidatus Bathyarchaeia archaeon]